jgi:hypothetical protein
MTDNRGLMTDDRGWKTEDRFPVIRPRSSVFWNSVLGLVLGLTARDRWQALQHLNRPSVMTSRWFTILMVVLLVGAVIALVFVSLYKKQREARNGGQRTEDRRQKTKNGGEKTQDRGQGAADAVVHISSAEASTELGRMSPAVPAVNKAPKELGIEDEKVANVAGQVAQLIVLAGLDKKQVAQLADFIAKESEKMTALASGETK